MYRKLIANELNDLILCYAHLGVCPLYHSSNDITLLLITSNVHGHETMINQQASYTRGLLGTPCCLHNTHVSMFRLIQL